MTLTKEEVIALRNLITDYCPENVYQDDTLTGIQHKIDAEMQDKDAYLDSDVEYYTAYWFEGY